MRRYLFLAIILIGLTAGITYSILIWDKPDSDLSKVEELIPGEPETDSVNLVTNIPLNPGQVEIELTVNRTYDQVILERIYTLCNHKVIEELKPDSPLLNLSRQELLGLYPGWRIQDEQGRRLVLQFEINDLCPEDLQKRYVGEKGGFVTIYCGEPGMKEKILKITDIPTAGFPVSLQDQLRKGIISSSEDHLISFIDGLASYYWE